MDCLDQFVEKVEHAINAVPSDSFDLLGNPISLGQVLKINMDQHLLTKDLISALGNEAVVSFFKGCDTCNVTLTNYLERNIDSCSALQGSRSVTFDKKRMRTELGKLQAVINRGTIEYTIDIRLADIRIPRTFSLGEFHFRTATNEEIREKFPKAFYLKSLVPSDATNWPQHNVIATLTKRGTQRAFEEDSQFERIYSLEHLVEEPFLISGVYKKARPQMTHALAHSIVSRSPHLVSCEAVSLMPEIIDNDDIKALKRANGFIEEAKTDSVFARSSDRFRTAVKRDVQHPNGVNQPNWDKAVDFIIALESLLLGGQSRQELTYRFQLNGSSLLSCLVPCKRKSLFEALKMVYGIRSTIVHGSDQGKVIKKANELLTLLQVDSPEHKHDIGRLILLSEVLECWLRELYYSLSALPKAQRPYEKDGGWEELLWGS